MARKVFFSFHFEADHWRAYQVRNTGKVEGNNPAEDSDWERIKRGGEGAIRQWIDYHMWGRACAVVLIGKDTADRKWINYEIEKAWKDGKGVLGIYFHALKDRNGYQTQKGKNPFSDLTIDGTRLDQVVKTYEPPTLESHTAYGWIAEHLDSWVEDAVRARGRA